MEENGQKNIKNQLTVKNQKDFLKNNTVNMDVKNLEKIKQRNIEENIKIEFSYIKLITYITTMSENKPIQLGLCCLNTVLRQQRPTVFASRKMIIRSVREKGIAVLKEKIKQNL